MMALTTRCRGCGAALRVPLRPGPSGALRIGAVPVPCPACGRVGEVGTRAAELAPGLMP